MCGDGPALMVGEKLHGRVTPERAEEILARERATL
jgi:NADH-quinone oxidoreductase subunit E